MYKVGEKKRKDEKFSCKKIRTLMLALWCYFPFAGVIDQVTD